MRKREAAQDEGIDHGELRGHTANAEREDQHSEEAKRFLLDQDAETDADILQKRFEHMDEVEWLRVERLLAENFLNSIFSFPALTRVVAKRVPTLSLDT